MNNEFSHFKMSNKTGKTILLGELERKKMEEKIEKKISDPVRFPHILIILSVNGLI